MIFVLAANYTQVVNWEAEQRLGRGWAYPLITMGLVERMRGQSDGVLVHAGTWWELPSSVWRTAEREARMRGWTILYDSTPDLADYRTVQRRVRLETVREIQRRGLIYVRPRPGASVVDLSPDAAEPTSDAYEIVHVPPGEFFRRALAEELTAYEREIWAGLNRELRQPLFGERVEIDESSEEWQEIMANSGAGLARMAALIDDEAVPHSLERTPNTRVRRTYPEQYEETAPGVLIDELLGRIDTTLDDYERTT